MEFDNPFSLLGKLNLQQAVDHQVFFAWERGYLSYNEPVSNANKHFKSRSSAQLAVVSQPNVQKTKVQQFQVYQVTIIFLATQPDCLRGVHEMTHEPLPASDSKLQCFDKILTGDENMTEDIQIQALKT